MAQSNNPTEVDMIAAHQLVVRRLAASQRIAVAVPLILLIGLVSAICLKLNHFAKVGARQTLGLVVKQSPDALKPIAQESAKAIERLAPIYTDAIGVAFERDQAKISAIADKQVAGFISYAKGTQVVIASRVKDLTDRTANSVLSRLTVGMTPAEAAEFKNEAALALYNKVGTEIQTRWHKQVDLTGRVCGELYSIALTSPEAKGEKPSVVLGAGMELMGRKIQGLE